MFYRLDMTINVMKKEVEVYCFNVERDVRVLIETDENLIHGM